MASVAHNTVGDYWVSTISIDDFPYPLNEDHKYETVVFKDRGEDSGRIAWLMRSDSITEAQSNHDKITTEIIAGNFVPEWPKRYGKMPINSDK